MNKTNLISKAIEKPFSFIFPPTKFLCFYIDTGEKDVENSLNDPFKTTKVHLYIFLLSRPLPWCFDCDTHELGMIYYKQTFVNSNDKSKDPDLPLWKDEVYKDEEGIGQDKQDKHQDPLRPAGSLQRPHPVVPGLHQLLLAARVGHKLKVNHSSSTKNFRLHVK